jgi:hypothetical protein
LKSKIPKKVLNMKAEGIYPRGRPRACWEQWGREYVGSIRKEGGN